MKIKDFNVYICCNFAQGKPISDSKNGKTAETCILLVYWFRGFEANTPSPSFRKRLKSHLFETAFPP